MKTEWQVIQEICTKICHNSDLVQDLIQEISIIWLELDPDKKQLIRDKGIFSFWVARTVTNQWHSSTSTFYTKYRREHQELPREIEMVLELNSGETEVIELINEWISFLFPSERTIVNAYYYSGLTIAQISAKFSVDKNFVWNTIHRVLRSFRRKLEWHNTPPSRQELAQLIRPLEGKTKLKIEERQLVLDVANSIFKDKFYNVHDRKQITSILTRIISHLKD